MPTFQSLRGRQFFAPSVIVDVKNELVAPPPFGKSIAVFGDFPQLEQGEVYTFRQSSGATIADMFPKVAKLRNIEKFWRNSLPDFGQAEAVSFINAMTTVQASNNRLGDDDANSVDLSAVNVAQFKSRYWGRAGNQVAYNLSNPDTTAASGDILLDAASEDLGFYRLTIFAPGHVTEPVIREVGYSNIIKITYQDTDAGSDIDLTITNANGILNLSDGGSLDEDIILADLQNLDDLKTTIENIDGRITVDVLNYSVFPRQLDEGVWVLEDVGNAAVSLNLHAHVRALEELFERETSLPLEITLTDGRYRLLEGDSSDSIRTTLSGGSESASTSSDYSDIFRDSAIISKDFTTCVVESTSAAVLTSFKNYLSESELSQKERNGWFPAAENLSIDSINGTYVLAAKSNRISVVGQSLTYIDWKGNRAEGTCFETALLCAFMQGSVTPGQALTEIAPNQESLVVETTEAWDRDSEANKHKLVRKGIVGLSLGNAGLKVIRSITTHIQDNELFNCEVSVKESIDASVRDLRSFLTGELGATITSQTKDRLKLLTENRLTLQRERGVILGFKNVVVNVSGDTAFIEYDVALSNPQNFIVVTANIVSEL